MTTLVRLLSRVVNKLGGPESDDDGWRRSMVN